VKKSFLNTYNDIITIKCNKLFKQNKEEEDEEKANKM
jgi:hypothetical protein